MNDVSDGETLVGDGPARKYPINRGRFRPGRRRFREMVCHCKGGRVFTVQLPERAPESGEDEGMRRVRLWCQDRRELFLCLEDAGWAMAYLRDQLATK